MQWGQWTCPDAVWQKPLPLQAVPTACDHERCLVSRYLKFHPDLQKLAQFPGIDVAWVVLVYLAERLKLDMCIQQRVLETVLPANEIDLFVLGYGKLLLLSEPRREIWWDEVSRALVGSQAAKDEVVLAVMDKLEGSVAVGAVDAALVNGSTAMGGLANSGPSDAGLLSNRYNMAQRSSSSDGNMASFNKDPSEGFDLGRVPREVVEAEILPRVQSTGLSSIRLLNRSAKVVLDDALHMARLAIVPKDLAERFPSLTKVIMMPRHLDPTLWGKPSLGGTFPIDVPSPPYAADPAPAMVLAGAAGHLTLRELALATNGAASQSPTPPARSWPSVLSTDVPVAPKSLSLQPAELHSLARLRELRSLDDGGLGLESLAQLSLLSALAELRVTLCSTDDARELRTLMLTNPKLANLALTINTDFALPATAQAPALGPVPAPGPGPAVLPAAQAPVLHDVGEVEMEVEVQQELTETTAAAPPPVARRWGDAQLAEVLPVLNACQSALTSLDIGRTEGATLASLSALAQTAPHLLHLGLHLFGVRDAGVGAVSGLLRRTGGALRSLTLHGVSWGTWALDCSDLQLALRAMPQLESLHMCMFEHSAPGPRFCAALRDAPCLTALALPNAYVTDHLLQALSRMTRLQRLNLHGTMRAFDSVTDAASTLQRLSALTELRLDDSLWPWNETVYRAIASLPALQSLDLSAPYRRGPHGGLPDGHATLAIKLFVHVPRLRVARYVPPPSWGGSWHSDGMARVCDCHRQIRSARLAVGLS